MKLFLAILTGGLLTAAVLFSQGPPAPDARVTWDGNHATIAFYLRVNHYLRAEVRGDTLRVDAVLDGGEVLESWEVKTTGQPRTLKPLPDVIPEPREK
jgi:hypothetical protein